MRTKKKSKFLTFCFSMIPGAAQMYMGFMKMGLSLMVFFALIIIFAVWLNQGALAAFCVIAWFYSFFQANHLASLSDEEFYQVEDDYLFGVGGLPGVEDFVREHHKWIAILLIFIGACLLWDSLSSLLYSVLPDELSFISRTMRRIGNYIPSLVIGSGVIALGVKMLAGRREETWQDNDDSASFGSTSTGRREEPWERDVFSTGRKEESWRKAFPAEKEKEEWKREAASAEKEKEVWKGEVISIDEKESRGN